jgi:lipopolysaccharide/colanic/teichoic acid biosynthesis glycosyltransferase
MTWVGPRPLYVSQIAEWTPHQRRRLEVLPGLTGLAQTAGRGALTQEAKLALDVRYVEEASWQLDFKILWATVRQVFGRSAIYEEQYSETETTRRQG